jgi:hypothetical protein
MGAGGRQPRRPRRGNRGESDARSQSGRSSTGPSPWISSNETRVRSSLGRRARRCTSTLRGKTTCGASGPLSMRKLPPTAPPSGSCSSRRRGVGKWSERAGRRSSGRRDGGRFRRSAPRTDFLIGCPFPRPLSRSSWVCALTHLPLRGSSRAPGGVFDGDDVDVPGASGAARGSCRGRWADSDTGELR